MELSWAGKDRLEKLERAAVSRVCCKRAIFAANALPRYEGTWYAIIAAKDMSSVVVPMRVCNPYPQS